MDLQYKDLTASDMAEIWKSPDYGGWLRNSLSDLLLQYAETSMSRSDYFCSAKKRLKDLGVDGVYLDRDFIIDFARTYFQIYHGKTNYEIPLKDRYIYFQFPGWKLCRCATQTVKRNWRNRWTSAGDACDWQGVSKIDFIALKTSPIWNLLGKGAGGFDDALGNPFPPFAWKSSMGVMDVDNADCISVGIPTEEIEKYAPPASDKDKAFEEDIIQAAESLGLTSEDFK